MVNEIESTFLRYLIYYYSNFSLQLRPVSLHNKWSLFNLLWNLSVLILCWYYLITHVDPEAIDEHSKRTNEMFRILAHKPLLRLITRITIVYAYPVAHFSIGVYFILLSIFNGQLLLLLDSFPVPKIDARYVLAIILLDHWLFMLVYCIISRYIYELDFSTLDGWLVFLATYASFYILNVNLIIVFGLTAYYKHGTVAALQRLSKRLHRYQGISLAQFKQQIHHLGHLNSRLNRLLSFPLMMITLAETLDVTITLAKMIVVSSSADLFDWHDFIYILLVPLFMFYLAMLQRRIEFELGKMEMLLKDCYSRDSTRRIFQFVVYTKPASTSFGAWTSLVVYRSLFSLTLFSLCTVNYRFVLLVILCMLNYVVLLSQTSA